MAKFALNGGLFSAVVVGAALASAANATTYTLDVGSADLTIATSGSVTDYGVTGQVITGISGTVGGVAVDTAYTGLWGPTGNRYQVDNGLYVDENGSPNLYTLHGVYSTGGADYVIDNVWFPSANPSIDYDGGVAFLLNNGVSYYIYGNCNPNQSCSGYQLFTQGIVPANGPPEVAATPLPPTWTMLIAGFIGLGFFVYRGAKKNAAPLAAA
jgi:hypothetical protein